MLSVRKKTKNEITQERKKTKNKITSSPQSEITAVNTISSFFALEYIMLFTDPNLNVLFDDYVFISTNNLGYHDCINLHYLNTLTSWK